MARRKRKESEPEWVPPEFDDVGYMRQEIEGAKVALVTIAWAFVGAVIAVVAYDYVHPVVGFFLGLMTFGALYFVLPIIGLPIAGFKRRDWASHGITYFFSWLAFWILLLNPPFADHTAPTLSALMVGPYTPSTPGALPAAGTVTCVAGTLGSTVDVNPGTNSTLLILFRATDNVAVARVAASLTTTGAPTNLTVIPVGGQPNACQGSSSTYLPGTYAVLAGVTTNIYLVFSAWDTSGLSTTQGVSIAAK